MAIVKRHDIDGSKYDVKEKPPQYLIDMPGEGHAVLISERWLLTVGHVIFGNYEGLVIDILGEKTLFLVLLFIQVL